LILSHDERSEGRLPLLLYALLVLLLDDLESRLAVVEDTAMRNAATRSTTTRIIIIISTYNI